MTDHDAIAALCERLGQAHHDKDAGAIVACFAPDALIYSLAPPLSSRGMDLNDVAAWLATWDGPIAFDAVDVDLVVDGGLAIMTSLQRMHGNKADGEKIDFWFRVTTGFQKRDGSWKISHDHSSTPFRMDGSYRAAVDLQPERRRP